MFWSPWANRGFQFSHTVLFRTQFQFRRTYTRSVHTIFVHTFATRNRDLKWSVCKPSEFLKRFPSKYSAIVFRYNFYELHYKRTEFNFGEFRLQTRISPLPIRFLLEDRKRDTHFFDSLTQHLLTGDKPIGRSERIKYDRYVKLTS